MSKEQSHIKDELLIKHMLGETSQAEQVAVQEWVAENDTNKKHYDQFKAIWDGSKQLAQESTVDVDDAWNRFQDRVKEKPDSKTIELPARKMNWMRIAAMLVLFLGCTWSVKYFVYDFGKTTLVADNAVISETLPDGTVVTLNKHSSLKYKDNFDGDTRDVILKGEAFFDVERNEEKPFIIDANGVEVKVLGTSFNVKSSKSKTEVIVRTGLVKVSKKENSIKVKPNEKATVLNNKPQPIKEENLDALYNYYHTNEFVCKNTPLWRLAEILNEAYDVHIIFANDNIKNMEITTIYKNEPIDYILNNICQTLNIKMEKSGGKIILK